MTTKIEPKSKPSLIATFFDKIFPVSKPAIREADALKLPAEVIDTIEIFLGHHIVSRQWTGGATRFGCHGVGVSAETKDEIKEAIRQYEYAKFDQQFPTHLSGATKPHSVAQLPKVTPKIQPLTQAVPASTIEQASTISH